MENPGRRAADEKVLRIDHSDVYFENDRLTEELDKSLDTIFREKHRKFISHMYDIRQLREALNKTTSKNSKTVSSVAALRPHTTPTYARTRVPRVVKLDVHVPSTDPGSPVTNARQDGRPSSADHSSNSDEENDDDGADDEEDDSANDPDEGSDDGDRDRKTRGNIGRAQSGQDRDARGMRGGAGGGTVKDRNTAGDASASRKVTKQQLLLDRLKLSKVPESWFTEVLPASGPINTKRRATSALPYKSAANLRAPGINSSSTRTRKSRSGSHHSRRHKSAMTPASHRMESSDAGVSVLVCGGEQDGSRRGTELRSRRQLMELSGFAGEESVLGVDNPKHAELREAARLERERLDARVKLFLQSCDRVHGGGISSRKERHYSRIFLSEIYNT